MPHRVLLVLLPLLLATTAPAASRTEWEAPVTLFAAPDNETVSTPRVGIDGSGTVTALWASGVGGSPSRAEVAQLRANGSWTAPRAIPGGAFARLAVNARGEAVSAWTEGYGRDQHVRAAFRTAGGRWLPPRTLSPAGEQAFAPRVGLDARGRALVVWESFHSPSRQSDPALESSTRAGGGSWSRTPTLCACSVDFYFDLAVAPSGKALLVWAQRCCGTTGVKVAGRSAAGRWTQPQLLSTRFSSMDATTASLNARGTAVVTWGVPDGLDVAVRPARGRFARPQLLGGDVWAGVGVGLTPTGASVVTWATHCCLYAAARRPGAASFAPAQTLVQGSLDVPALEPTVAMDRRGDAIVAWMNAESGRVTVQAARGPAGGVFAAPVVLGDVGADCYKHGCCFADPAAVSASAGSAVVLWLARPDPSKGFCTQVHAATFTR
jgi:hypothetical protein